jgi:putative endonuclease
MNYYIYILKSLKSEKYYVGYTTNITLRLEQHNKQEYFNTYTSIYRPWQLEALFFVSEIEKEAIQIERFIKKQKNKNLILKLLNEDTILKDILAQLVRVPHVRD